MGKSDDSITRRKNKRSRKKEQESNKVSNRVAAIIAAKKRRLTGKRRMCQGMCFSLPTAEDPFNERHAKVDLAKKAKKTANSKVEKTQNDKGRMTQKKRPLNLNQPDIDLQEQKKAKVSDMENNKKSVSSMDLKEQRILGKLGKGTLHVIERSVSKKSEEFAASEDQSDCPSKFLMVCLNKIQKALQHDAEKKPFFVDTWGVEFWKSYFQEKDVLETSSTETNVEQIAWIASTAADTIARKEREGQSFASPFLLFLVPTQAKASKVREICKPLKACGIHTVSLHAGASIEHQIHGLKSCEPEFLVSTPERLLELISLNAVDISGLSMLVIEGLKTISEDGYHDAVLSVKQSISGNFQTVVFSDCPRHSSIPFLQNIFQGSLSSLTVKD